MQDVLKIMNSQRMNSRKLWSNPFLIGQGLLIFLRLLTSLFLGSFVLFFAFSGALSLYTSCVLRLRFSALFNEMNYLFKKTKSLAYTSSKGQELLLETSKKTHKHWPQLHCCPACII
jgi:hypothetical protein